MSSVDLSIIQKGASSDYNWTAGPGKITAGDLGKVGEQRTDNNGALNAVPSPYARFFVFREAFRRVLEEKNSPAKVSGLAYQRLVSNCLDVFELLYNKVYHENRWGTGGPRIVIREWDYSTDLQALKENVPILGNAVESYFEDDLGEKKLFFIVLVQNGKEYLLAASSPYTGFITPPDMDLVPNHSDNNTVKRMKFTGEKYDSLEPIARAAADGASDSRGYYFQDIQLFADRPADFKNYMYHVLFGAGGNDPKYTELKNYIRAFSSDKEIAATYAGPALVPVLSGNNNELTVNGVAIMQNKGVATVNYFSDTIIKLPYRISSDGFMTLQFENDKPGRDYDYLIPLSAQALGILGKGTFSAACKEGQSKVTVTIKHGGNVFTKEYYGQGVTLKAGDGRIVPLAGNNMNFDLALFPNVLSANAVENNYFKVLVSAHDGNPARNFAIGNLNLEFYKDNGGAFSKIEKATDDTFKSGVRKEVVRSQQGKGVGYGSKTYEVFNTAFDAVLATVNIDGKASSFALFPVWKQAVQSNKNFVYAVDFGTSNTYIARRLGGAMTRPEQLTMNSAIVSYLHDRTGSVEQQGLVNCMENGTPEPFKTAFKTEFLPPYIDGSVYKFPIRTALCHTGQDKSSLSLFDNSNIAFFYEKSEPASNQSIITGIKWSSDESQLRLFIRELLLIIKADILQENGTLSYTEIIWFRPLSFKESERSVFERIWKEESQDILNLNDVSAQIKCYTESEAPYFYFNVQSDYKSVESVAIIDIGGGSTDFVYFRNGDPKIANSIHFGCDKMWGNGWDELVNSKKNGIYDRYRNSEFFKSEALKRLNGSMISDLDNGDKEVSTADVINFWINNDAETKISKKLCADFSFVFAYHFTATMYYLGSMLKAQGLDCPRTITFSGNGSRYIDNYISSDNTLLTKLTESIMSKIYGKDISNIQLILPEVRKESTCYGGLYCDPAGISQPKYVVYQGDCSKEECKDVKGLKEQFPSISNKVLENVVTMNGIYAEVLGILINRGVVDGKKINIDEVLKLVNSGIDDCLKTQFQKVIAKYADQEQYRDSLFFMPVIENILKLTNYKRG